MSLSILPLMNEPVPLKVDSDEVIRVGNTRVTFDTIVAVFKNGATPEEIIYQFPTLNLSDVYAVISYYLRNEEKVNSYLSQRQKIAQQVLQQNQTGLEYANIRKRLSARREKIEKNA